jgi:hypothetical protein
MGCTLREQEGLGQLGEGQLLHCVYRRKYAQRRATPSKELKKVVEGRSE